MADSFSANMEVRSPQPTFSSGNYKKILILKHNEEETSQEQPLSPQTSKPMPPLEPLSDEMLGSCVFVSVHPKKRLKMEHDDPMLAEAAASPLSSCKPCSPMSMLSRIGDERTLRSPTTDNRTHLDNIHLFSGPNSPYSSLHSTLDPAMFGDPPYSPGSLLSPSHYPFSPVSASQVNSPTEFFPPTGLSVRPSLQENGLQTLVPNKVKEELSHQKQCPRPQSVALDLTSLEKHKPVPWYATYHHHSRQQQQQQLVSQSSYSSLPIMLTETHPKVEIKKEFQSMQPSQTIITHTTQPQVSPHGFHRSAGIVPANVYPKIAYSQSSQQQVAGTLTSRQARIPRLQGGGGVIRPTPHFYQKPLPSMIHHPFHRGKFPYHHFPSGNQSKRMPSEMIYNHQGFPRDLPNNVPLQPPAASSKKLSWLNSEDSFQANVPTIHDTASKKEDFTYKHKPIHTWGEEDITYKHKPIHTWEHQDVMYFMFSSIKEQDITVQDLNFSELSGVTGKDLLQMTIADFHRFSPRTAELMFRHFKARLQEEKRQQPPALVPGASAHQDIQNNRLVGLEASSPFDFINQPNNFFHPPHQPSSHHQLQQHQPVLLREAPRGCDAAAPYELRYETVDARSIGVNEGDRRFIPGSLPSASRKTFQILDEDSTGPNCEMDGNSSDPELSNNEEAVKPEPPPKKRGPGRPRKPENELKKKKKKTGRLWEFIRNLLHDRETCPSMVRWENPEEGVFRFVQAEKVAQRWGARKQNKEMNYEKLSRAMRYYYKGEVFEAVLGRRLVYKFGKNAKNWRPTNPNFVNHGP